MSATICALRCLVRGKSSRLSKLWHEQDQFQGRVGEGKGGRIFAWLMSLLWQICGSGVAVVARAFRNGVAAGS